MQQINWMKIATWTALVVCLLLAFGFGYSQWSRLQNVQQDNERVDKQIVGQTLDREKLEKSERPAMKVLAAPDNRQEEVDFLVLLDQLSRSAHVRQIRSERITPLPLSTYAKAAAEASPDKKKPPSKKNAPVEPSLLNMPLGVHPVSVNFTIQGTFPAVRDFTYQLNNYRYDFRAININSLNMRLMDDKNTVQAVMTLTRFVRPDTPTMSPIRPGEPPNPAARPGLSSSITPMGSPRLTATGLSGRP